MKLGIIDHVIPEPLGGTHRDPESAAVGLEKFLASSLEALKQLTIPTLLRQRQNRIRGLGSFFESQEEQQPAVDLHASSKAVRIEAQDPPVETVPPIAAAELSAEPSVVTTADTGENDDTAAAKPPSAEGPPGPSDQ